VRDGQRKERVEAKKRAVRSNKETDAKKLRMKKDGMCGRTLTTKTPYKAAWDWYLAPALLEANTCGPADIG
jgi:hypothetical protein